MTTEEIIADLRQNGLTSASIYTRMERAANRLEELQRDVNKLRRITTRAEPSRLEIAAMMLAALASRESGTWESDEESIWAVEQADILIATAREAK